MNYDTFLKLLQSVITMTDEKNPTSVASGKAILVNLKGLIWSSGMAYGQVMRMLEAAISNYDNLIKHKEEFAGVHGEAMRNEAKRERLAMTLYPHC